MSRKYNLPESGQQSNVGSFYEVVEEARFGLYAPSVLGGETPEPTHLIVSGSNLENLAKSIEGQVLTIIEATQPNKEQLEAQKSLFRRAIWDTFQNGLWAMPAILKNN